MSDSLRHSVDRPSSARVYDYILGGSSNYAIDREWAKKQLVLMPDLQISMRANRAFLGRAVRHAVGADIRQFVDIGSGLPTEGNVHEVADEAASDECRVVYLDNEPVARATPTSCSPAPRPPSAIARCSPTTSSCGSRCSPLASSIPPN